MGSMISAWNRAKRRLLMRVTADLPMRDIRRDNGGPYLERYYLGRLGWLTFHLHRYRDSDGDEHLHNHPFAAVGIPLVGSYSEEYIDEYSWQYSETRYRRIRFWNRIPTYGWHRIAAVEAGTWTLFIRGRRFRRWGFVEARHSVETGTGRALFSLAFRPMPETSDDWWRQAPTRRQIEDNRSKK